jgi:plasmid maintenance system antidote protein VapI
MAEKDIVGGIFGMTPEMYQAGQTQRDIAQQNAAIETAGPGLFSKIYAPQIQQQAQLMSRAVGGVLGIEDPQLQMVREVSGIRNQFDITTPEGMQGFAQAIAPKYPQLAVQAVDKANQMMTTGAAAQTAQQKIDQEKKLREELNTLGDNATDEDILRIVRKYGTPDQVMRAVQSSMDKKNAAAAKAAAAINKPLPASLQKEEGKDLEAYDSYASQKEALMPSIVNLTPDAEGLRKLELGPVKNAKYAAQNAAGNSTPESRAYEALKSAVGTAVNLQVSAEKGVQTDKDVLRFADALISAYGKNDTQATLEALQRYYDAINRAQQKAAGRIESRRKSQNVEPYFQGQAVQQAPAPAQNAPAAPQQAPKTIKFNDLPKG